MNSKEIISKLKKTNQPDEYILAFLDFCCGEIDEKDFAWAYGKYIMRRYGTSVVVEWDPSVEGFDSL